MKKKWNNLCSVIIILSAGFFIYKCSSDNNYTKVIIYLGSKSSSASFDMPFIDKLLGLFSTKAYAQVPPDVTSIGLTVSGSNMKTINKTYSSEVTRIALDIPAGSNRTFTLFGNNAAGSPIYRGISSPTNLMPGGTVTVSITMAPFNSGNKIYVSNWADDHISVIDGETNNVDTTIAVGNNPAGIGINNNTGMAYVSNDGDGTVSVINTKTNTVTATLTAIANGYTDPVFIVDVNPNTNKIYISRGYEAGNYITEINGADNTVSTIDVGESYTFGVCINPSTNKIYVSAWNPPVVINGLTDVVIGSVSGGSWSEARDIGVNPNTNKIYVVADYSTAGSVYVVNGSTDAYSSSISVQDNPYGVGVNPVTNKIYIANYGSSTVSVIDGSTDTVSTTITVGTNPMGVAVNPVTNRIYVANWGSQSVSVINGATDTVITTVTVANNPSFLEVLQ
jgi:YVTN family beta-propeller protein